MKDRPGAPASLEGFDIVCLGTVEWLVVHSIAEHTMARLARKNRVLFVEPLKPLSVVLREIGRHARRPSLRWGLRQVDPGLWVYTPPPLGVPGASRAAWCVSANARILRLLLARPLRRLGFDAPLLWTYLFYSASLLRGLRRRLAIYDCIDLDEAFAPTPRRRALVRRLESDLCREADLVFGVTSGMVEKQRELNAHTYEVPSAGDVEHFGRARLESTTVPSDLARLPRPVLGYLGGVDPWKIDVPLLRGVALARPDWTIVLVGYVWFGFDPAVFRDCPNIHILGSKPYEDFPRYLKGMDVCLIPFPRTELTRLGDPLKCYEYLAGGKPVVSTSVPVARRFPGVVRVADTPADFVAAVEASLAEGQEGAERRAAALEGHTWDDRVAEKSRLIMDRLAATTARRGAERVRA